MVKGVGEKQTTKISIVIHPTINLFLSSGVSSITGGWSSFITKNRMAHQKSHPVQPNPVSNPTSGSSPSNPTASMMKKNVLAIFLCFRPNMA